MGIIRYTNYTFVKPTGPVDQRTYDYLKGMEAARFGEYVRAAASEKWREFRARHAADIYLIAIGAPLALVLLFLEISTVISAVCALVLLAAFYRSLGLMNSTFSHVVYVKQLRSWHRSVRNQVVLTPTYEDYASR